MQLSPPQQSNNSNDDDTTTTTNNNDTNQTTLSKQYSFYNHDNKTSLFRGIEIAALQSAIEKYCYVISYNNLKRIHIWLCSNRSINNFYINVLYGYISQWVHLPITIPLDVWKTHIQLVSMSNDTSNNNINQWKILYNMIKDPNVQFYKGLSTYIIICWKPAIQYTIYEYLKRKIITYNKLKYNNTMKPINSNNPSTKQQYHQISWKESIVIALISRTIATILIFPHIRAKFFFGYDIEQLPMTLSSFFNGQYIQYGMYN